MTTVGILYGKSSVCLSVTLRYHDHMGWNSSQIILWLISWWMVFTLCSADPNIRDLLWGEQPTILTGIRVDMQKVAYRV